MSEVVAVAIVSGGISGLVGIAGLGFSFWNSSQERAERRKEREKADQDWYKRTLFERRLAALQESNRWLNRLSVAMYSPYSDRSSNPVFKALEWYYDNLIYIHGGMPVASPLGRFLYSTAASLEERGELPEQSMWQAASEFIKQEVEKLLREYSP